MTPSLPDPARSRAVLVGVGRYADPALADLPAVEHNLADLHALLTSPHGTGLPSKHCVVVPDPADQAEVGAAVARAAAEAEDMLLVYYAGHGLLSADAELWLATARSRRTIVAFSSLSCAELRKAIGGSPARRRVLVLDCCFAGRATRSMSGDAFADQVDVPGVYTLAATAPNALALAPSDTRPTLFTGTLLSLLRGGVQGEGDLLTLDVLYRHLRRELPRHGGSEPALRDDGAGAGGLALARNAAERVATLRAELERVARDTAELARAESALAVLLRRVGRMVAGPPPTPPVALAAGLRERHGVLAMSLDAGEWPVVADGVSQVAAEVATARAAVDAEAGRGRRLLDERAELRGRLDVFHAMAVRLAVAENAEPARLHAAARDLLTEIPSDLVAAGRAVAAYQRVVVALREAAR